MPELRKQLYELGPMPAGDSANLARQDFAYWRLLIRAGNVKVD
jgi:hypothetical protein